MIPGSDHITNLFLQRLATSDQGTAHIETAVAPHQVVHPSRSFVRECRAPVFNNRNRIDAGKRSAHSRCGVLGSYFRVAALAKLRRDISLLQILRQSDKGEKSPCGNHAAEHRWATDIIMYR